jgi:hypothetical protein
MIDPINPELPILVLKGSTEPELTVEAATSSTTPAPAPVPEATAEAPSIDTYKNMSEEEKKARYQEFMKDPAAYCFGGKRKAPTPTSKPNPPAPQPESLPAAQLLSSIGSTIREWTNAPKEICTVLALWVLGTYFADCHPVLPCLVISGPAHHGMQVLRALQSVCSKSVLLPEFKRHDVAAYCGCWTILFFEPNLNKKAAALLGTMTSSNIRTADGYLSGHGRSVAVYVGDRSPIGLIPYGISIDFHATDTVVAPALGSSPESETLKEQLNLYREANLPEVRRRSFSPTGLLPEMAEIARTLGGCLIAAPQLQEALVKNLQSGQKRTLSNWSTEEAIVVEALRNVTLKEMDRVFVKEIAAEANRLLELRGEKLRLSPEKIGHLLRKLGLPTRRLSQAGNGLVLDAIALARIEELAAMYVPENCLKTMEVATDKQVPTDQVIKKVM